MNKKRSEIIDKVYYPEEIPGIDFDKLVELADKRSNDTIEKDRRYRDTLKQQRISTAIDDKYTHAIKILIEWEHAGKKTIPYYLFNFDTLESKLFTNFLDDLKEYRGLVGWSTNPYKDAYNTEFIFEGINTSILTELLKGYKKGTDVKALLKVSPDYFKYEHLCPKLPCIVIDRQNKKAVYVCSKQKVESVKINDKKKLIWVDLLELFLGEEPTKLRMTPLELGKKIPSDNRNQSEDYQATFHNTKDRIERKFRTNNETHIFQKYKEDSKWCCLVSVTKLQ